MASPLTQYDVDTDILVSVSNLGKTYDSARSKPAHVAIESISFDVAKGEFLCVVGPSGCGKTTLLRCISGLMPPTHGTVLLHNTPVSAPPPELALVFQEYTRSLFPWMTVMRNVEAPLKKREPSKARRLEIVQEALDAVDLKGFECYYPWQLSGGMQQRVAIARAIAYRPEIMVMDEPFASVDAQTRTELEDLLLRIRMKFGVTVIFVTHDIDESVYLGDRIVILSPPPCTVQDVLTVNLPRPRHQIHTKSLPLYDSLRESVYDAIMRK